MADINFDVTPKWMVSAYIVAPFDEGKRALAREGHEIISLEEDAMLRIQEGANEDISKNGNWVREGAIYVPDKGIFLTKNSPIMSNAEGATNCHRNKKEFYLTDEQVEEALAYSVALSARPIPTNRFADDEITSYAFGDVAERYGQFLKKEGVKEMSVFLTNTEEEPFARQVWLRGLVSESGLSCDCRDLYDSDWVRGARVLEVYTVENIQRVLGDTGLSELEEILVNGLRQ